MLCLRLQRFGIVLTFFACVLLIDVSAAENNSSASLIAREWPKLLRKAQHGDHKAQTRVAIAFKGGEVVKQNFAEPMKWFSEAAKHAEPIAESNLGLMYYFGQGVERNLCTAVEWFELAASHGVPEAQFNAANLYETGLGVLPMP